MKQFNGYAEAKEAAQYTPGMRLPAGGYVCKIMGVRWTAGENGNSDQIALQFDIVEGEYKDFFKKQYENQQGEDKKWKGVVRIYCPKDDGTEKDKWTKNAFARWTDSIEKSNPGYAWDWDETKWKGKMVGITFGETGTVIEGKEIVYTEARSADSVENIRSGKFFHQKFKTKNGYGSGSAAPAAKPDANGFMQISDGIDEEIPF